MKVLLIYFNKEYRPRTSLSLSIIEAVLKERGHQVKIFDTSFYKKYALTDQSAQIKAGIYSKTKNLNISPKPQDPYEDFKQCVFDFDPDWVGFSYYSFNADIQKDLLTQFKRDFPQKIVVAGGPAACINPADCLNDNYIDLVCCGEGESFVKELCYKMETKQSLDSIKGLWRKTIQGKIISNGVSDLCNMDDLPRIDWDSFDPKQIYGLLNGKAYRMGHVEFTRGCPYNCTYCGAGSIRKQYEDQGQMGYVRNKSPEKAIAELKYLKDKYNLEMFYFVDGTFLAMPFSKLEKLAELYKKEINLPFIALIHPNTVKQKTVDLLKKMGCSHVSVGVESGVEKYREEVLGRRMSNEQIIKAIHLLRGAGIHVSAYNIIGLPGMDRDHVFKTIDLNKKAGPHSCIISIFIPFMDSTLTQYLISKRLLDKDKIVIGNGVSPSIEIADMTQTEIMGLYNTFNLYVSLPIFFRPLINKLEVENKISRFIRYVLYFIIKKWESFR